MAESQPTRLLTTRFRTIAAIMWTAVMLAQAIRTIVRHAHTGWLVPAGPLFHGWMFVGTNAVMYCWICWIAFLCIRRTVGKERVFMVGLFGDILLWALRMLLPQWAIELREIGGLGLAIAILAALALLLDTNGSGSNRTDAPA